MSTKMNPTKATKLLRDYQKNNFNAKKTLIENGYSEKTATQNAKKTLAVANRVIKEQLNLDEDTTPKESSSVLDIIGFTKEEVVQELVKVIKQDRDLSSKLKAIKPMLDSIDYRLDEDTSQKTPSVNITLQENEVIEVKEVEDISDS